MTSLSGDTSKYSLRDLKKENIPSLKDVLDLKLKPKLIIEVKSEDLQIVSNIVKLVADSNSKNRVLYKSFNRDILKEFRRLDPIVDQVFVFVTSMWGMTIDTFLRFKSAEELIDVEYYQLHYSFLNKSFISKLHNKNKKIILWGVNSKQKYLESKRLEVFGIETDYPDLNFP